MAKGSKIKLELPNISSNGGGQARAYDWYTYSDARVKKEVHPISYGIDELMQLNPVSYHHHSAKFEGDSLIIDRNEFQNEIGFLAQDVYQIMPEIASKPSDENKDFWALSYSRLIPVLIHGMQQQQIELERLRRKNEKLDAQIHLLMKEMQAKN